MNSPIGWIGGKRALRKEIIELFPQEGVGRYIEVFFGAGWVFFGREKQPGQLEVINDRDGQIVNLFRCIKYHRAALQEELEWLVSAREIFFAAMAQLHTDGLTDIQRAARFFYLLKNSFGCDKRTFATSGKSVINSIEYLEQVQKRLKGVVIENRDKVCLGGKTTYGWPQILKSSRVGLCCRTTMIRVFESYMAGAQSKPPHGRKPCPALGKIKVHSRK